MGRQLSLEELNRLGGRIKKQAATEYKHKFFDDDFRIAVLDAWESGKDYVKGGLRMYGIYERPHDVVFVKPLNGEFCPCGEINLTLARQAKARKVNNG